jgi:hypothetical protein
MFVVPSTEKISSLDAFMDIPLEEVYQYGQASTDIRSHLQQAGGALVIPLRGAAPLEWSAEGLAEIEPSPTEGLQIIQVPSGVGTHVRPDTGAERFGRLYRSIRKNIIRQYLATIPDAAEGITVLDEVQIGGTVTRMANLCAGYAAEHGISLPVQVITGESLETVDLQRNRYKSLIAGEDPTIRVAPVRLPMIYAAETFGDAHNRALVPNVVYTYDYDDGSRKLQEIEVKENPEAELLFRLVGSMSRNPTLARDYNFVHNAIDSLARKASGEDAAAWAAALVDKFSN